MDDEFQVTLSRNEISLLVIAINTSKDFLQSQKGNIFGAMAGFTKIDTLCEELDKVSSKLGEKIKEA